MRYVVMECYPSFAVVLAEDGRFLNVANMHYEVGQTVNDVFEMQFPVPVYAKRRKKHRIAAIVAMATILLMMIAGILFYLRLPYASVYLNINPSVKIDVKKDNEVMDIKAMNYDGEMLIAGYSYDDKHLEVVTEELVYMAMQMGYLSNDDEIRISVDADEDEWENYIGYELKDSIQDLLSDDLRVKVIVGDDDDFDDFDYDDVYDD